MKDIKRVARRGMVIFLCAVALCMFFARTVQNLTTPKARFSQAETGKLSKFYNMEAQVFFQKAQSVYAEAAKEYPATVGRVLVEKDQYVKAGDPLMELSISEYDEKYKALRENWQSKAAELMALDQENRLNPSDTERNRRYQALLNALNALSDKRVEMLSKGQGEDAWKEETAAYEKARDAFYETYLYSSLAVTNEAFEYVKKRNALMQEMDEGEKKMTAMLKAAQTLKVIQAPNDGMITALEVKAGDTYAGVTPLYAISSSEQPPVLRAYTAQRFALETKAAVKGEWDEIYTTVVAVGTDKEGQKYVDFELNQNILDAHGGLSSLIKEDKLKVTVTSRASASSTLIASSCLREEGGSAFVYTAQYTDGGLLGGYYTVKKVNVTVLDRSDAVVSVREDLSAYRLVDREDRVLKEDMRIMEQTT